MALLRPRVLLYETVMADGTVPVSGPLNRWYGPTLAQQPAMPATVMMGAGPAPTPTGPVQYSPSYSQAYPVRTPLLVPRELDPLRARYSR